MVGECWICICDIQMGDVHCLDECDHLMHPEWFRVYLIKSIDDCKIPIVCPLCPGQKEIAYGAIKEFLDEKYQKRYDHFSFKAAMMKNAQRFFSCPTPDCEYVFCLEAGDRKEFFWCPKCNIDYCLECESEWHTDYDCKEYQRVYGKGKLGTQF